MCNIYKEINNVIEYGIKNNLIDELDKIYIRNKILEVLKLYSFEVSEDVEDKEVENIERTLDNILDWAVEKGLIENNITERDLLDTKIMGVIIPRPSEVIKEFNRIYKESPIKSTDYYYNLSKKSNYVRTKRVEKDLKWKVETDMGNLDITINMSKPEKDPKEIEKALKIKQESYPKCLLCKECEGYEGRLNYPARGNHRLIPLELNNEEWFLQYSPYVYFNEHSILLKGEHLPMSINKDTFVELLDFTDKFKHYFIGSNADLPIVGGSILTHDHYQCGKYEFAIENAKSIKEFKISGFENVEAAIIKWPLSVIRLRGNNKKELVDLSKVILDKWKKYSDEELDILAFSDETSHNTITPIARYKNNKFEMDLVLRNNRTSKKYPDGIFHPHKELHHIKKENIGLIEVMGLAVLPSRLKLEIEEIKKYLIGEEFEEAKVKAHIEWVNEIKQNERSIDVNNVEDIIKIEIGNVFLEVLKHCGVFKISDSGLQGFEKFINSI